jgi:hypothetical protein
MTKITAYHEILHALPVWEDYLRAESHLPGPRSNLELAQAAADLAAPDQIERLLLYTPEHAPQNTPDEFLAVCGTIALGRLLVEGKMENLPRLRELANDPRWRIRESVAMALQRLGDSSMDALLEAVHPWYAGTFLDQRAAAAALCEPRLLKSPRHARAVLDALDSITDNIQRAAGEKSAQFKTLCQGMSYCWSVAVAALPDEGKARFETWLRCPDPTIQKIMRANLKKNRLIKMDEAWVNRHMLSPKTSLL